MGQKKCIPQYIAVIAALAFNMSNAVAATSVFDFTENDIERSPLNSKSLKLWKGEKIVDFDVSKIRPEAAIIIKDSSGKQKILFWQIGKSDTEESSRSITVPAGTILSAITWHPLGNSIFLMAKKSNRQEILKTPVESWKPTSIYHSKSQLRRLVIGPRPFTPGYRIFFGIKKPNGKYATHSISEKGRLEYAVLDSNPASQISDSEANVLIANSALPNEFHPAGSFMLWEDENHCFQKALYQRDNWGSIDTVLDEMSICGGSLNYTPNGASLLHWKSGKDGVTLISDRGKNIKTVAEGIKYVSTPSSVPDGKGLVGVIKEGEDYSILYSPIKVPLADVVNAWMFLESPRDSELISQNSGVFRDRKEDSQLYNLYESESYSCGSYDVSTPTRPYFVTTDIFFELYASAFEGIFILSEKQSAIPEFWQFVQSANENLKKYPDSKVAKAFAALTAVHDGATNNEEATRILKSEGFFVSSVTNERFDFGNLKPRSHYTTDSRMQNYFRASKYLMDLKLGEEDMAILKKLPQPVIKKALDWIKVYSAFVAPSKRPLTWRDSSSIPPYVLHAENNAQIFPLSWGMDNEVIFSTVYHENFPEAEQIKDRMLPSGLDVASVLGSKMAEVILNETGEFNKYPHLRSQIENLKSRYSESKLPANDSLYQKWLAALATQWSDNVAAPGNTINSEIWENKRLQTGLASWATLRHATVLVNERGMAECGESGFEAVILRPPRGYVEPDPQTFEAIASLFDATIEVVNSGGAAWSELQNQSDVKNDKALQDGVIRRLTESRDKIRMFRDIAKKEIEGKPLTNKEYEEILYVGRAAEHNFLIFKSLSQEDFALSNPDPIPKVADVAESSGELLLVGVGSPIEWDQVVPFFGRKQIVKGSIYSYYETKSDRVMTDSEWRSKLSGIAHPEWLKPFFSPNKLSCPAREP